MAYIDELRAKKAKYEKVKSEVTNVKNEISPLKTDLDTIIEVEKEAYSLDELSADQNLIRNQKAKLESAESIATSVIASIDNEISNLTSLIAEEEARLAAAAEQERLAKLAEEKESK